MISRHHLAEVIGERTLNVSDTKVLAREIAAYLLDAGQTADFEVLLRDVMEYRAQKGVIEAVAISAYEIDDRILSDIEAILRTEFPNATDIIVVPKIDTSVVGGVKVSLANEQLDMTVREKIDTFKRLTANIKD